MAVDARRIHILGSESFKLQIHELEPTTIEPLGDRYVVEAIPVDEAVQFGQLLIVTEGTPRPGDDPRNPMANPQVEARGVLPAVIIATGNGHLLGLPDLKFAINSVGKGESIAHEPADVPMFLTPGDVALVDINNRGRALRIAGRELRIVNQIDILARVRSVRLKWTESGWGRE